jgi:REP element-mobilizing transposase RayT
MGSLKSGADVPSAQSIFRFYGFQPFNKDAAVLKTRRRLPHWQQEGTTCFVTFRLADSMPLEKLKEWQAEKDLWLRQHPGPLSIELQEEYKGIFDEKFQSYLDAGYGSCILADPEISRIVRDSFHHFDEVRYDLGWYVIMPNHVHILVKPLEGYELSKILQGWKGYTAKEINRELGKAGTVWLDESFDHIVRSLESLRLYEDYIRQNPIRAGLKPGSYVLGRGKARFE